MLGVGAICPIGIRVCRESLNKTNTDVQAGEERSLDVAQSEAHEDHA